MRITNDPKAPSGKNYALDEGEILLGKVVIFLTGPITGNIALADGSHYSVDDEVIAVHPDHVDELHARILDAHHAAGRYLDVPSVN